LQQGVSTKLQNVMHFNRQNICNYVILNTHLRNKFIKYNDNN